MTRMRTRARLLIVGPQGSGKGTQGIRIAEAFGIPAISTGDVFRAAIASGHRARPAGHRASSRPATSCPTS